MLVTSRLRQRVRLAEARVPQTRWAVLRGDAAPGFPAVVGPLDRKGRRLAEQASGGAEVTVTACSHDGAFTPLLGIDLHAFALDAALGQSVSAEYVRFGPADAQVA